jgi:hypothetical protein
VVLVEFWIKERLGQCVDGYLRTMVEGFRTFSVSQHVSPGPHNDPTYDTLAPIVPCLSALSACTCTKAPVRQQKLGIATYSEPQTEGTP